MTKPSWERVEMLFHGALEQPPAQRRAWLSAKVREDAALFDQVMRLIDCADDSETVLHSVLGRAAAELDQSGLDADRRLGPYRIVERLGRGGMGEVYLAERDDQQYRQRVAIKVIRGFPGDEALERFRRERQILAELQHPYIARLLDGGTTAEGQPYLVMDFVDGLPLSKWCDRHGPDLNRRLRLMGRICEAIHHAHQNLIIHRDIKPGNVLVTAEGMPIVVDFGIAKVLDDGDSELTRAGLGYTPGFASPEQLAGRAVTTASDIYGLGRLMLALLDPAAISDLEQGSSWLRRPAWTRRLPRDLVAVIDTATREDPQLRYASVAALREDLLRYLDDRPVQALPNTLAYRASKFVQRQKAGVLAAALGLALVGWLGAQWLQDAKRARLAELRVLEEAGHAEQVLGLLLDTIGSAAPAQARGQNITVEQVVERSVAELAANQAINPAARQRMELALGEVYLRLERYDRAAELLQLASRGESLATRARALSLLGFTYLMAKQVEQAGPILEQALAISLDQSEVPTATQREIRNHHALWLSDTGRAAEAEAVFAELAEESLTDGQKEPASRMLHNQALALASLGRWSDAAELLQETLRLKAETTGTLHPSYANSSASLAQNLSRMGQHSRAREAMQQAFEIRQQLFGSDHPGLHYDHNELGSLQHDEGRFVEAIAHYEKAIQLHQQSGESRSGRSSYINNLAFAHEDRGDPLRAEPLFRESLDIRLEALGDDHPAVALARHNLGRLLIDSGRLDEGRALVEQAVAVRTEIFGADHHATVYSRSLLALLDLRAGRLDAARRGFEVARAQLSERLPPGNGWLMAVERWLAETALISGDRQAAEALLADLAIRYDRQYGSGHPHLARLRLDLAWLALQAGQSERATELIEQAGPPVLEQLTPDSQPRRQLACLQRGELGPECWRAPLI